MAARARRRTQVSNVRGWTAERALQDAIAELEGVVASTDRQYHWLLAHRVLEADDRSAIRDGLIGQADGLSWGPLDALYDLAMYGHLMHLQMHHPVVDGERRCDLCHVGERFMHVTLHDPITSARGTTCTDLSDRMLARVRAELRNYLGR